MPHITADRVRELSNSTGTGNITLSGPLTSFRSFASVLSVNDTFYYTIAAYSLTEWEVGIGTYVSANTIARSTVIASSNSNSLVNFSAGDKDVFITAPASRFLQADNNNIYTFNTIPAFNGGVSGSTAPFTVDSNTVVTNLNADLLDGQEGSYYLNTSSTPQTKSGMLTLTNTSSQSITDAALWLSGTVGSILLDDSANKRISWNDGFGNFNIRAGHYANGVNEVYHKAAGDSNSGAAHINIATDAIPGAFYFRVAEVGVPGTTVPWKNTLTIDTTTTGVGAGGLKYNDSQVWHAGNDGAGSGLDADTVDGLGPNSGTGDRWGHLVHIQTDGVAELGRYIDFHSTDADATDFTFRFDNRSNGIVTASGIIEIPPGTVGSPSLSFSDDTNTGIYRSDADTLSIAANGGLVASFPGSGGVTLNNGLVTGQNVVVRGGGVSAEGGQIVLGYGNNTTTAISGQANSTWNIDVAGGAANNNFRIFRVNGSGAAITPITIDEATGNITTNAAITTGGTVTAPTVTVTNQILSGGPSGFIRDYSSGYSTTHAISTVYEIGRMTITGNSQNITVIGDIRVGSGADVGRSSFTLNIRSQTLPTKDFTLEEQYVTYGTTVVRVKVYNDTASGLVVIGYTTSLASLNAGWNIRVQERGNYNYFTQVTALTTLNTAGLTEITPSSSVSKTYTGNLSLLGNTTIGDAAGDTLTINSTAVSIPNNLNFDSNTLFIDSTNNRVGIGTNAPSAPLQIAYTAGTPAASLITTDAVIITAENTAPGFSIVSSAGAAASRGVFKATRSRGTLSAPTAVQLNDQVFSLLGAAYDGNAVIASAAIDMIVDGTVSIGSAPQAISFSTGTTSRAERMRISSAGNVLLGTTVDNGIDRLQVNGSISGTTFTGTSANSVLFDGKTIREFALFDGTNAIGNWDINILGTSPRWETPRLFTIGSTSKYVDGSSNVNWSLNEIGAWHAGNDGAGSGLDADLLDGKDIGTSGNTIPLLDGINTWSIVQTFNNNATGNSSNVSARFASVDGSNHGIWLAPKLTAGSYNNTTQAGDSGIFYSSGAQGTGALVIAPWAAANSGVRMDSSGNTTVNGNFGVKIAPTNNTFEVRGGTTLSRTAGALTAPASVELSVYSQVSTNSVGTPQITLHSDRADRYSAIGTYRGTVSNQIGISLFTSNDTATPTERVRINPAGEVAIIGNATQLLLKNGSSSNPTLIHRNDGTDYYLLLSAAGTEPSGTWNTLRPLTINLTTGLLSSSNGQSFAGTTTVGGTLTITGTTATAGHFYAGTTNPSATNRVNYNGALHATSLTTVGAVSSPGGIRNGAMTYPIWEGNLDFGSDVAGTWRKIVGASLIDATYSTISFKIEVIDPNSNHGTQGTVNPEEEIYYVACVRTEDLVLNTPDLCVVRGPGNRIRAIKTAVGVYEIQIQNEAQFREYFVRITPYALNYSTHTIEYFNLGAAGTAIATYTASVGTGTHYFANLRVESILDVRGAVDLADNDILRLGDGDDWEFFHDGTNNYVDLNVGDMIVRDNTTTRFTFARTTGDFTATGNITAFSDIKLKKDLEQIQQPISKVKKLTGYTYTRIDTGERQTGLVAQDVQKVLPEAVKDGENLALAYGNMVGLLVEAIKEQQTQIEELKTLVNSLLNKQ